MNLKKIVPLKILLIALLSNSAWAANLELKQPHPLHGKWSWMYAKNNCVETYEYRRDGSAAVTSGEEVAQSQYEVSDTPDSNGFYRMTDIVMGSNGLPGCDGNPGGTPIGDKVTVFIFFNPAKNAMILCRKANIKSCMGPLTRAGE